VFFFFFLIHLIYSVLVTGTASNVEIL